MDPMSKSFVAAIHAYVQAQGVPLLAFDVDDHQKARNSRPAGTDGRLRRRR